MGHFFCNLMVLLLSLSNTLLCFGGISLLIQALCRYVEYQHLSVQHSCFIDSLSSTVLGLVHFQIVLQILWVNFWNQKSKVAQILPTPFWKIKKQCHDDGTQALEHGVLHRSLVPSEPLRASGR